MALCVSGRSAAADQPTQQCPGEVIEVAAPEAFASGPRDPGLVNVDVVAAIDASGRSTRLARGVRRTYLHRPAPPVDGLDRSELNAVLDRGLELPMSLVCAPAGFGKSVAVSQWCERVERPVVWFSLDPSVDDPQSFLLHVVEAICQVFPEALPATSEMLSAEPLPALERLIAELSNELDDLPEPIVVVLDDYQSVTDPRTHRLVADLLRHPSISVHLVLVSREEPALPIATLRAQGRLVELRMADLAFSPDEFRQFIEQELGHSRSPEQLAALHLETEGWPAGARLAAEALRTSAVERVVGAGFLDHAAQEYLVAAVLEGTPPQVRRHLAVASHFDQFSAALCDAASAIGSGTTPPGSMTGAEFIDWIRRHNLFVIPLDDTGGWFRFHHLFARLLANWRVSAASYFDVSEPSVHRAAAGVFREQGMLEEAIEQLVLAGDDAELVAVARADGDQLVEEGRWAELARLVALIPAQVLDADPELLLLQACVVGENESRHRELVAILDRAELLLDHRTEQPDRGDRFLRGQIAMLRGVYSKFVEADFEGAIADAETAIGLLADHPGRRLVLAYILEITALAGAGRSDEAHRLADSLVGDARFAHMPYHPAVSSQAYVGWLEGDLDAVRRSGAQMLSSDKRAMPKDIDSLGHYFLGVCAYEQNRLDDAERHLAVVLDRRYSTKAIYATHAGMALASTNLAQGRTEEAATTAQSVTEYVLDMQSEFLQPVIDAFMAEFDLRLRRQGSGLRWARSVEFDPDRHRFMWFDTAPAVIEVLLTSEADAARGRELLDLALESARRRHHRPLIIRLLGIHALDLAATGDECAALGPLEEAVVMSQKGGFIRRLADLGPRLTPLLQRLHVSGDLLAHVGAILAAIDSRGDDDDDDENGPDVVIDLTGTPGLTGREQDVLRLLAARFSNKEIARELMVAPATVKKHTVTLYDKLGVHDRREAVAKARTLGYVDR